MSKKEDIAYLKDQVERLWDLVTSETVLTVDAGETQRECGQDYTVLSKVPIKDVLYYLMDYFKLKIYKNEQPPVPTPNPKFRFKLK